MKDIFVFDTKLLTNGFIFSSFCDCFGLGCTKANVLISKLGLLKNHKVDKSFLYNKSVRFYNSIFFSLISRSFRYRVTLDARYDIQIAFQQIRTLKNYKYIRHLQALPVRGQKSRYNAKTQKLKRKYKHLLFYKFDERQKKSIGKKKSVIVEKKSIKLLKKKRNKFLVLAVMGFFSRCSFLVRFLFFFQVLRFSFLFKKNFFFVSLDSFFIIYFKRVLYRQRVLFLKKQEESNRVKYFFERKKVRLKSFFRFLSKLFFKYKIIKNVQKKVFFFDVLKKKKRFFRHFVYFSRVKKNIAKFYNVYFLKIEKLKFMRKNRFFNYFVDVKFRSFLKMQKVKIKKMRFLKKKPYTAFLRFVILKKAFGNICFLSLKISVSNIFLAIYFPKIKNILLKVSCGSCGFTGPKKSTTFSSQKTSLVFVKNFFYIYFLRKLKSRFIKNKYKKNFLYQIPLGFCLKYSLSNKHVRAVFKGFKKSRLKFFYIKYFPSFAHNGPKMSIKRRV